MFASKRRKEVKPLRCNIYEDQFRSAELFGKPVLYTEKQIQREMVPEGWHCYDLTGTDREPDKPVTLEDRMPWNRTGTVLSPVPLKRKNTLTRQIKNRFSLHEELLDLAGFCEKNHLSCPQDPRKYVLRPASHDEAGLFYSQMEEDAAQATVGHLRMDFGGGRLHHSWWPHNDDQFNTPEFKAVFQEFVDELRALGPLQSEAAMHRWCYGYPEGEIGQDRIGFVAETEDYRFCLRCTTDRSDYSYIYCYDLNQQKLAMEQPPQMGLTEQGRQKLRDTADPRFPHSYDWYVMESCSTAYATFTDGLSLEDAIQCYISSENDSKRLGVTKDDIAAVDLLIRHDGREWVSEDWTKSESFAQDPTVADAAAKMRQLLDAQTPNQGMTIGGMV
jgi:hypothetical protein